MRLGVVIGVLAVLSFFFLDWRAAEWVDRQPSTVRTTAQYLTELAHSSWWLPVLIPLAIVAALLKRRTIARVATWTAASIVASGLTVNLLKFIFGRYRPQALLWRDQSGFEFFEVGWIVNSFPSGHSATAGALAAIAWFLWPSLRWLWVVAGVVVASTRVFTLSHFPSDVLVGGYLGILGSVLLREPIEKLFQPKPELLDGPKDG